LRGDVEADIPVLPKRVQHRHGDRGPTLALSTAAEAEWRFTGSQATGRLCHDVYGGRRDPNFLRESERAQAGRTVEGEGEAGSPPSREPDVGLDPRTLRS